MRLVRLLAFVATCVVLAGCVQVSTDVDSYSVIPANIEPKTVYVAPYKGMGGSSLPWQSNARILARVLAEKGFTVVDSRKQARLVAFFGFGVDKGERVTTQYLIPQWGYVWPGAGFYGGPFYGGPGPYWGWGWGSPFVPGPSYGVVGYTTGLKTETVFTRSASIDMIDTRTGKKVFQGRGVSRGTCASFAPVAEPMLRAVLANFPAGKAGRVTLPMSDGC